MVNEGNPATVNVDNFISRWADSGSAERANYQLFLSELCDLLGVDRPAPTTADDARNIYVFEKAVTFPNADGTTSTGRIDLYRRGHFVCETKQGSEKKKEESNPLLPKVKAKTGHGVRGTQAWDAAMVAARGQAERYVRAIPDDNPPFVLVIDVGYSIEVYSDFSRLGKIYTPFPDARSHRIYLKDLAEADLRERLKLVWTDPLALDPSRRSARVTREIADKLAKLAKSLEAEQHDPEHVAAFLMRCLFTLFAEDVDLIKDHAFTKLLEDIKSQPEQFVPMVHDVWKSMDAGTFSPALRKKLMRFNGGLFAEQTVLKLNPAQIQILHEAARSDWRDVEPAIFGTLLERALNPTERHKLGAHYTPRAYVERLVLPTIIEPLREEWDAAKAAAITLATAGKKKEAVAEIQKYLRHLCDTVVLDPACGSGNFLYVTLEHMKRLEGEVRDQLQQFGEGQADFESMGLTVDPHQFKGIEINPRAAHIADLVLWIGYLQWHFRVYGNTPPREPVLRAFHNIENRDAVLAYDSKELVLDDTGKPVSRWDGRTTKTHPVTGEAVPDESARVPVYRYVNPRKAEWPKADFVVGNPPFLGSKRMRESLGDGYVDAIQAAWPEVPQASDFVLRWWHAAASILSMGNYRRFGFITTNSVSQSYNRRAIEPHLGKISLLFSIPDHPWVDTADGADVRIAMTVAANGRHQGTVTRIVEEHEPRSQDADDLVAATTSATGDINADLTTGADVASAVELKGNLDLCCVGMKTIGDAFQVEPDVAKKLGLGTVRGLEKHIRPYLNGRDLSGTRRGIYVIDFYGLEVEQVRTQFSAAYQHLFDNAKPERDQNRNAIFRRSWWVIGHPRQQFRDFTAGLKRYIATLETSKHRFFVFLDAVDTPDSALVTFGFDDAYFLGAMSSRAHVVWSLAAGGRLGVGNDPRYNKTRCFETFPFPVPTSAQQSRIRELGEQLDAHRKKQQAAHPGLTITDLYNVLEKLRAIEVGSAKADPTGLTAKEKTIHEQGLTHPSESSGI